MNQIAFQIFTLMNIAAAGSVAAAAADFEAEKDKLKSLSQVSAAMNGHCAGLGSLLEETKAARGEAKPQKEEGVTWVPASKEEALHTAEVLAKSYPRNAAYHEFIAAIEKLNVSKPKVSDQVLELTVAATPCKEKFIFDELTLLRGIIGYMMRNREDAETATALRTNFEKGVRDMILNSETLIELLVGAALLSHANSEKVAFTAVDPALLQTARKKLEERRHRLSQRYKSQAFNAKAFREELRALRQGRDEMRKFLSEKS